MEVVYQDRWIVVVSKPAGLASQASQKTDDSVVSRLQQRHRYVALHHRLDVPASGLLVVAIHRDANAGLSAQVREHRMHRRYRAVLVGELHEAGTWDRPVDGRPAVTAYTPDGAPQAGLTACWLAPHTGRKHQLRIHAALAGVPICGDRRHGGEAGRRWPRLALHAAELGLTHPVTGEPLQLVSPLPPDLAPLFRGLGVGGDVAGGG